ncbi:hypothetical protein B5M47_01985 [candidate division CPR3 bacterium 4484_211]|uniref:Uncharacterized protein n=1 Tax=candidate division CPR3 bacterium 4484_211 TaxID=1968527 RepID=A0A1W9NYM7_UNCC3|nr:MAG: hypothetical protein B5M47_01985 [candidate division CPR3 bacterium 4484_211]
MEIENCRGKSESKKCGVRIQNSEFRIQVTKTFPCLEFGKLSLRYCLKSVIWVWFDIGHF